MDIRCNANGKELSVSEENYEALKQCIKAMVDDARRDCVRAHDLLEQKKCTQLRLAFLEGRFGALNRVLDEFLSAETKTKGGEA